MIRRILRPITADSSTNTETSSNEDTPITCEVDGVLLSIRVLKGDPGYHQAEVVRALRDARKDLSILAKKAEAWRVSLRKRERLRPKAVRKRNTPRRTNEPPGRPHRSVRIDLDSALWPKHLLVFHE